MNFPIPSAKDKPAPRRRAFCRLPIAFAFGVCLAMCALGELAVPAMTGRVVDQAGLLGGDAARVENAIRGLEQATAGQMAVLTVPSLRGDALESFSMRVAEAWKIGRKGQDNGALLVVVRDSRGIRLEIGYGWEGSINDARAGDVIRGMGPFFRSGRFADGCLYAVQQVQGFVTGKPVAGRVVAPSGPHLATSATPAWLIQVVVIFLFLGIIFLRVMAGSAYTTIGRGSRSYGGWSGGGSSGSGFSGGGGSFGGGGASGSW